VTTTVDIASIQGMNDLLSMLETENEIILTDADRPIVTLTITHHLRIPKAGRVPDAHPDIWISDGFDDQLPEKYWIKRKL
jgi:hypothetical protein